MQTSDPHSAWWRGKRGEWFVLAQVLLMALVFLGPRSLPGLPIWQSRWAPIVSAFGVALFVAGLALLFSGLIRLGRNLTPLPAPAEGATLITSGPFAVVRHPMYSGGLGIAFGWALFVRGPLTLVYAAVLIAFLNVKASWEERRLKQQFPEYAAYQRRVPKLLPSLRSARRNSHLSSEEHRVA